MLALARRFTPSVFIIEETLDNAGFNEARKG